MKTICDYVVQNRFRLVLALVLGVACSFGAIDPSMAMAGLILDTVPLDLKTIHEETKKALAKIGDEVKEAGQKALAEAKKAGDMYAADKPKVDEMLVKQGELQARLLDVEQKVARRGSDEEHTPKTAGETLTSSPEYKAWIDGGGMKSTQSGFVFPVPRASLTSIPTTNTTTVGVPPQQQPLVPGVSQRLTVRDLLTPGQTSSNLIQYVKETGFTNLAATVSETVQKPESVLVYELMQSGVVTIAHWIKASKQILDDFLGLQSNIDGRLRYGLALVEETQLLKGSGVGNNLNGIYTQATAYSPPITIPAPTKIDTIRLMLLQAELAEYPSTGIVLNPKDWAAIELTKDTLGRYIIGNPQGTISPTLWGRPVVATQSMTVDTALVGAFRLGAQIFDREDANVVISTENQDDFIKNMVTIRAEERVGLAVYRPEAFVKNADLPAS
jgi:HK97 family phage major capsid protein